jgi:predicted ATPase/class 3 adenylate cyclase
MDTHFPSGTVTFLFSDIEGSTQLQQKYPEQTKLNLARHDSILRLAIEANNGYIFKTIGDAFCAAFHTAGDALLAAMQAQTDLHIENWGVAPIKVRMGLHTGLADIQDDGDYNGYATLSRVQRLMAAAHGGQTIISRATQELVREDTPPGIVLRDEGEHRLKDLVHAEHIFQVDFPNIPTEFPALKTLNARLNNLPAQLTPFFGRAEQISSICKLLLNADVRLITLIGPGGTGKTRISLQAAQEVLDQFPNGVFFVPLADDTDSNQFISRLAQQLEVREGGRPLLANVKDFLHDKCLLLILDNFEQLVSAAPVVGDLLSGASQLKILVSSRIALNLHGEHEYSVPPLNLPPVENEVTAKNLARNESILLFVERASAAQPNFILTDDNASAVAQICRRLDGLPLALELAAARVKLLSPQAILARLDDRLRLLTGGARDLPARHQTLRNTLEWSYGLLNQDEKTLFTRLGVFVGGFTLEAAEMVCNTDGHLDILERVTSLVNNSLLRQEITADGEPRLGMLETLRAYALERLVESGELETIQGQHARYFGDMILNRMGTELFSANATYWLNWIEREHDNIRATLAWSLTYPQGIELGARLVMALNWFWYRRGFLLEGSMWTERVLDSPALQPASAQRAMALETGGMLSVWRGNQDAGLTQLRESLAIEQKLENEQSIASLLTSNAVALINMGQDSAAQPLLMEAQGIFKTQNNAPFRVITLVHLGNAELGLGNPINARALHEEALTEARAIGENWLIAFGLNNLGEVARVEGQYDRARAYYEQCKVLLNNTGDNGDMARYEHSLGYVAQHEKDYPLADSQFRKSLAMFRKLGNRRGISECLAGLAGVKARQGQSAWGATMLSAAETLLHATGGAWWPADRVEVERNRAIIKSTLKEDEFSMAWKTGAVMTIDQAIAFASKSSEAI